ncbi:MAG: LSM domain protein [Methanobacteriaceae archaeon]|nr:LSM domain protein [Methanobacteriaceae archaeon]
MNKKFRKQKVDYENELAKQFRIFKNKNVQIAFKNNTYDEGKIIALDNYLNTVLETDQGLRVIKGGKILFISINE